MADTPTRPAEITEDELLLLSARNDNLRFELVNGELITMPPLGGYYGELEAQYVAELAVWSRKNKARAYSPSTGFRLANGDIRSPDAAAILSGHPVYNQKIEKFIPGAPDFLIEIRSRSDSLKELKTKMRVWMDNGVRLAWLIDPVARRCYVYRKDGSTTEYPYTAALTGEDVLPGFHVTPSELDPES